MSDNGDNGQTAQEKRKLARALAKANDLLRIAGHAARLGGWELDINKNQLIWTDEIAAIHEVPPGTQPTLEDALNYYPPEYRDHMMQVVANSIEQGLPFDEVVQLITATGRRIWVRAIGEVVRDETGKITHLRGAFQDISELMQARAEAHAVSARMTNILETISDGFLMLDQQWYVRYLNARGEQLLQRNRGELLGKNVWDAFPAAKGSLFQLNYELAVRDNITVRFTEFFPPLDAWFDVSAFPSIDGLTIYFRDVTERIEQEATLKLTEERFNLITRATNDVVWDWDPVNQTIWWNENLFHVFGYDPDAPTIGSESWTERIHPDDRDQALHSIRSALAGKASSWQYEYRYLHANGQIRRVSDSGFIIRDDKGKAIRMLGSMADVTDAHEMSERLRQAQKLEAVGQLTGGVAHDFNNLLTVILGNAELLTEQLTDKQQLRLLAEMTATAAERGAELTNRLLAFARRQPLEPQRVKLPKLIRSMDTLIRRTLSENIDIEMVFGGGLWMAEVDPNQLESALLNLAINARDAMPSGGKLTIEASNAFLDDDYAAHHEEVTPGQYVMISVTDTGNGMSEDILDRVFEPFFTTKQMGKGSGLGLSMVYGFVKQSRGHIKIYSEIDEGTCIKLYLPRAVSTEDPIYEGHLAPEIKGGHEKILVVEDNTLVLEHVSTLLKGLGYQVVSTSNADEAQDVLTQLADIDLLFTDIVMPGTMNGRQLAELAQQIRPGIRILFTSGYTENAIVHHGRLDRGVQLLNKPYRRQELAAKVRKVLEDPK